GLEVGSIRRIQETGYGVLEFLSVGTTFEIFQNIYILSLEYDVLSFFGYGLLDFIALWSFATAGTDTSAGALLIRGMYETDALASSWGCPKTKLRCENEKWDIPCRNTVLALCMYPKVWSSELYLVYFPGVRGDIRDTILVHFVILSFILFTFPFSLHHMSFGPQNAGDAVVLKFDMHVYTSVLTFDEVKNLVAEYAIPLDLHPCVPPSCLTMNRLLVDKIGIYDQYLELSGVRIPFSTFLLSIIKHFRVHISQLVSLGLNRLTMFEIYSRSLEIKPSVIRFRTFYKLTKQGHLFSFECRSGKGGQGKIFNEFWTSLKHLKDQFFLIDRRVIPDAMPWRHQDSSGADPAPTGVLAEDIRRLCENIIDLCPVHPAMLYAVGLTTIWKHVGHHSVFKDGKGTGNIILLQVYLNFSNSRWSEIPKKSDHQRVVEYENERVLAAKRKAHAAKDRKVRKRAAPEGASQRTNEEEESAFVICFVGLRGHGVSSYSGGSHHRAFPRRNPGGDGIDILRWYEAPDEDYGELFESHWSYRGVFDRLTETQNQVLDTVRSQNQLSEDHKALQQLEADFASKTSSLTEAEGVAYTLKCDLERLIVDLSQAEIVRHNYVRQLLPIIFQRLLSSDKYKILIYVFNLAIAAGWSEGVKATCSKEEAEVFLAIVIDYDPACKDAFMSEFDSLFDKSYPYVEKLVESFRLLWGTCTICGRKVMCVTWPLALRLIKNVLHSREVRWAQSTLGSSSTHPALSLRHMALIPSIKLLLALFTRPFA
nr:hypothetical protein [Tanacetum cinerariifolium]